MKFSFTALKEFLKITLLVLLCTVLIRYFVFQPFVVEGASMEPSYHNHEYLLIEKIGYKLSEPKRGDVVVFRYPNNPQINYIKRIIGLPGDTIRIEGGKVFINNTAIDESGYLSADTDTLIRSSANLAYERVIDAGHYFVMGDNRTHSSDSRDGWLVNKNNIIGKVMLTVYRGQSATINPIQ